MTPVEELTDSPEGAEKTPPEVPVKVTDADAPLGQNGEPGYEITAVGMRVMVTVVEAVTAGQAEVAGIV
jgi:hypothetical protein